MHVSVEKILLQDRAPLGYYLEVSHLLVFFFSCKQTLISWCLTGRPAKLGRPNLVSLKYKASSSFHPMVKKGLMWKGNLQNGWSIFFFFYIVDKTGHCYVFTFVSKVLIKKDFPFAKVPVPSVNYLDDGEPQVTLKCSFQFPKWGNVSFEVQWFVSGRSVTPIRICNNPNEGTCNRRESFLRTSEYKPGDTVSHGLRTFAPASLLRIVTVQPIHVAKYHHVIHQSLTPLKE